MPNWVDVLKQIDTFKTQHAAASQQAIDLVRRSYLNKLFELEKRNIIAYYSGFLSKPAIAQSDINDEDKNGFMMAVHNLDRSKGLDLILHTPGGGFAATESLVDYLRKMFGTDIRCIVPQIAMSAGTIIACSCKEIWMAKHSNLGPIDPQLSGLPARGVVEEFKRALDEIKKDPDSLAIWRPIIGQYRPTFLNQCENAIAWSEEFVREQLERVMFKGLRGAKKRAQKVVSALSDFKENKAHSRHINFEQCKKLGLKVQLIESRQEFQDLVLTVHHCYMHSLMNTSAFKIIENHLGSAFVKQQRVEQRVVPVN